MNFCTRCGSLYSKPGTCNCYAHRHVEVPGPTQPFNPVWPGSHPFTVPARIVGVPGTTSTTVSAERLAELEAQGLITYTGASA